MEKILTDRVVAIGSSCGGQDAVPYLVKKINKDEYIIILAPHIGGSEIKDKLSVYGIASVESSRDFVKDFNFEKGKIYINNFGLINKVFRYLSERYKENLIGVVLTGAGEDGAEGLKYIQKNGGKILAQSKSQIKDYLFYPKSIGRYTYEMPREAKKRNNLDFFGSLPHIANKINKFLDN